MNISRRLCSVMALVSGVTTSLPGQAHPAEAGLPTVARHASVLSPLHFVRFEDLLERTRVAPKGEFETTAEHQARVASMGTWAGVYAISIDTSAMSVSYDADKELLNLDIKPLNAASRGRHALLTERLPRSFCGIASSSSLISLDPVEAQNAFGARFEVDRAVLRKEGLVVKGRPQNCLRYTLAVPRPDAPVIKARIRAAVVFTPAAGPSGSMQGLTSAHVGATYSDPMSAVTITSFLYADHAELWLYDVSSGVVIRKEPISK